MRGYIFGYGSLLHPDDWVMQEIEEEPIYGFLKGHVRHFAVGIDNQSPEYDKKHYLEKEERATCIIGTLGINQQEGSQVNGLALPVNRQLLRRIGEREKSYYLSRDLRELFSVDLPGPLFTYYPREENHNLYRAGKRDNNIFLPARYWEYCREGFAFYDGEEDFVRLTQKPDYPIRDLQLYRAPGAI